MFVIGLMAAAMLVAGCLTSAIRKFKNALTAADPLTALSRLPTRLDP